MTPDELLRRHPRETVRWLRRRLGMRRPDLARYLGATAATVADWEGPGVAIAPLHRARLATLLAPHLATPEGQAFARSLGRDEEEAMGDKPREVTTFCPRCGQPIVWRAAGAEARTPRVEVAAWLCRCALGDEEWGALGAGAAEVLRERARERWPTS